MKIKHHNEPNTMRQPKISTKNHPTTVSGFTLVEIMVVVMIIGLLAALAIPMLKKAREDSTKNACINNLRQMAAAKEMAALANSWSNSESAGTIGNPKYMTIISQYIKGGERPTCPTGAQCFYNGINQSPTCQSGLATHVYNTPN